MILSLLLKTETLISDIVKISLDIIKIGYIENQYELYLVL